MNGVWKELSITTARTKRLSVPFGVVAHVDSTVPENCLKISIVCMAPRDCRKRTFRAQNAGKTITDGYGQIIMPPTCFINPLSNMSEKATFAAGCFWGVEASFRKVKGVLNVTVGYTGGKTSNPTYEQVCSDRTGHAESVLVEFDPKVVTYDQLLDVFWSIHDPTTKNRQGPDFGSQYRSAVFYHGQEQREQAIASKERLEKRGEYSKSIVTEIVPAQEFYPAEEYHQRYHEKHNLVSCRLH
jgi:peptide-methionine (S)-S-oxide reductase